MHHRSSTSALIAAIHNWLNALESGFEVCVVFLDVKKVFDSVPHAPSLEKLDEIGLNPYIIRSIKSYLTARVTSYKYCWSPPISGGLSNICNRTRRLIGVLYRKFYKHSSPNAMLQLHSSFIRCILSVYYPHCSCLCTFWSCHPYLLLQFLVVFILVVLFLNDFIC